MEKCSIKGNSAFTLIELLVVVLIIGILAAVALPQYQKAVAKSRFASIKPIAKSIKDAQEIYFETYGQYATPSKLSELDVDYPADTDVELSETDGHEYVSVGHDKLNNRYTMYLAHSDNFANNIYCEALATDEQAKALCVAEGATTDPIAKGDYLLYLLSGASTGEIGTGTTNSGLSLHAFLDLPYCKQDNYTCSVDEDNETVQTQYCGFGRCQGITEYSAWKDVNGNDVYIYCTLGLAENGGCIIGDTSETNGAAYEATISADGKVYRDKDCTRVSAQTGACEDGSSWTETYDDQGRILLQESRHYGDWVEATNTVFTYDSAGNQSSQLYICSSVGSQGECIDPYIDDDD